MILKFELPEEQANIIMTALGKQPYEAVWQIIAELQKQAAPQLAPPAPQPPPPVADEQTTG